MHPSIPPLIFGSGLLVMGALSFWGRFKWARLKAKATMAVNPHGNYDRAYHRRLRYSSISGVIYLVVGAVFFGYGVVSFLISLG
jgi:hypothetical protein